MTNKKKLQLIENLCFNKCCECTSFEVQTFVGKIFQIIHGKEKKKPVDSKNPL